MRAFLVQAEGGRRTRGWSDIADPVPGPTEVVVQVGAAALAWSDILQMEGTYAGPGPEPPFVSGHEFAGVVVGAGPEVAFLPGERVFGFLPSPAAFAEYVAAPARCLLRTPDELDDRAAAAITTSYLTADLALLTIGGLTPGCSVLVHAGAGGVGRAALLLAQAYGAGTVIATAGSLARRAAARERGASVAAGYDDFADVVLEHTDKRGVDLVLESVGGEVFDRSAEVTAALGRLVTIGASSGTRPKRLKLPFLWQRSLSVCGLHIISLRDQYPDAVEAAWGRVLGLLQEGRLDAGVGLAVAPADLEHGMNELRNRTVHGRVVIDFNDVERATR
ncbi:NADPH2:quinone reductase [Haloechinothrix alba]|uniref:NADPH2:quinone reductase n=1 Tax=Haloechinothrix alba TaxID=664784 RepID=A0A239AAZ7_9PSEU|nr:zinc-binding dehydrogenase [Haloechinothrix alba]SNR92836.1 NADPH2:quinone reductase [Haloechinothrix alba]